MDEDEPRFSLIGRRLDPRFAIRFICIPPGAERLFRGVDWADALVIVEHGILELVAPGGAGAHFGSGDILSMSDLQLRTLRNPGNDTVLLSAARRRGRQARGTSTSCAKGCACSPRRSWRPG